MSNIVCYTTGMKYTLKPWVSGSPSQENTFDLCQLRWWWSKRTDAPRDESPQTQRGTLLHEVMETYLTTGQVPTVDHIVGIMQRPDYALLRDYYVARGRFTDRTFAQLIYRLALDGVPHFPHTPVGANQVEHGFRLQTDGMAVPYVGFIDFWDESGIYDHKVRSAAKYCKFEDELLEDPQLRIYAAVHAAVAAADPKSIAVDDRGRQIVTITKPVFRDVRFAHINYCVDTKRTLEVAVDLKAEDVRRLFLVTERKTHEMNKVAQIDDPREVSANPASCNAFHKECPFLERCQEIGKVEQPDDILSIFWA